VLYFFTIHFMDAQALVTAILDCEPRDTEFLCHLIDTYQLDLGELMDGVRDLCQPFREIQINDLMHAAF
jgi:hypothetical protein